VCVTSIPTFTGYFTTPPASCLTPNVTTAQWNNFKAGWVSANSGYDLKDSFANCNATVLDDPVLTNFQKALCANTQIIARAGSYCGTLTCYTTDFNKGLSSSCTTFGQRLCLSFQPAVSDLVRAAVTTATSAGAALPEGYSYDISKVTVPTCERSGCPDTRGNPPPPVGTSGAAGKSIVAAVVFAVGALLL